MFETKHIKGGCKMKKYIVLFVTLMMVLSLSSVAFGENLNGFWTWSATWDRFVNGVYYSSGSGVATINIINTLSSSNDFTGQFINDADVVMGTITGKVIKATSPYTQDVIVFQRIDHESNYYNTCIGLLISGTSVIEGRFVDVHGNRGSFTLTKQ